VWSQIFLKIVFAKAGQVKGESTFAGFEDQINCQDRKWGMQGRDVPNKRGGPGETRRRIRMSPLKLSKRFDESSVKLLNCMNMRDRIVRARFSVAHRVQTSGGLREAFVLELEDGFIEDVDWDLSEEGKSMVVEETLQLRYSRIKVEYAPMNANGTFSNVKKTFATQVDDVLDLTDLFGGG
jgi:type VI secretion system Hcp family effector